MIVYSASFHTLPTDVMGIIPENFTASDVQSRNITFSWDPPSTSAANLAIIIGYTVTCIGSVSMASQDTSSTNITFRGLEPFTNYSCSVFARVEGNRGNSAESITRQTAEEGMKYFESTILKLHCTNSTLNSLSLLRAD